MPGSQSNRWLLAPLQQPSHQEHRRVVDCALELLKFIGILSCDRETWRTHKYMLSEHWKAVEALPPYALHLHKLAETLLDDRPKVHGFVRLKN